MPDLIINGNNITKQLETHFKSGSSDRSFLFHVPAEQYFEVNLELIKMLVNHYKYDGVYITFNKPYEMIASILEHHNISTANIWFIDVSSIHSKPSKTVGNATKKGSAKCVHLPPAMTIADLINVTNKTIHTVPGKNKFLFLESLTTLSFYFPDDDIVAFARFLSSIVDKEEIEWVILQSTPPSKKTSFHSKVGPHVHRVISLADGAAKKGTHLQHQIKKENRRRE